MTARERVMAALEGKKTDRLPIVNPTSVATVECMEACGAFFPDAHLDAEKMAKLAATSYDILTYDSIAPYFSVQQEAAAFGCEMSWGSIDSMPDVRKNPFDQPEDIVIPADFLERPSTSTVIEAIRLLRKEYGDQVCIVGKVMGPWTLSYHLYGVQRFLMDTILEPDKVRRFLEKLKEVSVMFANAQFAAGADVVTLADHATGDLCSPDTYRDFLFPVHQEVTKMINGPLMLHICGRTADRIPYIAKEGFAAFHFDSKNDLAEATAVAAREGQKLVGNINNPDVLYAGTPEDVRNSVFAAAKAGVQLIGPECAVPLRTPNANLKAVADAVREYCFGK
jgi:[methyl-Co(III) methanol-specific corrinoid protein]:coenzyme M methyltransferase